MSWRKQARPTYLRDPKKDTFAGVIRVEDILDKVRGTFAPPTQYHRYRVSYRRKSKHPGQEVE